MPTGLFNKHGNPLQVPGERYKDVTSPDTCRVKSLATARLAYLAC